MAHRAASSSPPLLLLLLVLVLVLVVALLASSFPLIRTSIRPTAKGGRACCKGAQAQSMRARIRAVGEWCAGGLARSRLVRARGSTSPHGPHPIPLHGP